MPSYPRSMRMVVHMFPASLGQRSTLCILSSKYRPISEVFSFRPPPFVLLLRGGSLEDSKDS